MSDFAELYRRHRPISFKQVIGQDAAIKTLVDLGKKGQIPHCLLLSGPSGCGKTTIARILRDKLKCVEHDYREINAAESRGIDTIRDVQAQMQLKALGGGSRIFYFDEGHRLTGDSQSALLKMLEDTPKHVYFFIATTDPQKLLPTIRTRATEIKLKLLGEKDLRVLLANVAEAEGFKIPEAVSDRIVDYADGSARKCLVLLNAAMAHTEEDDQLKAVMAGDSRAVGIDIARAVMNGAKWPEVSKLLSTCDDDIEGVRRIVLGYAKSVLLGNSKDGYKKRAAVVIEAFRYPWYDIGVAGLVKACWDLCGS